MKPAPATSELAQPPADRPRLPFTAPWLLAPMEGITDPVFRDCVARLHRPADLGGLCTEFLRISDAPVSTRVLRRHLGDEQHGIPVVLQLMGQHAEFLELTAKRAIDAGLAPMVDLNCGCPAKGALRGCAGSALLDDPAALGKLVAGLVRALPGVPVSAKIRSGGDDASQVQALARAVADAGASLVTVHFRTRAEAYCDEVHWERIARAVAAVPIPVCGNGSIQRRSDLERMRRETGCAYAMVGRGALADPWIFSGHQATRAEAAGFLLDYSARLRGRGAGELAPMASRLKQLLQHWDAGGLIGQDDRASWLRESDPRRFFGRLQAAAGNGDAELRP